MSIRLSVHLSVTKTPQPLRIMPISQISAYLSLLAIMQIIHNTTHNASVTFKTFWLVQVQSNGDGEVIVHIS